jgi:hypothetical protein
VESGRSTALPAGVLNLSYFLSFFVFKIDVSRDKS